MLRLKTRRLYRMVKRYRDTEIDIYIYIYIYRQNSITTTLARVTNYIIKSRVASTKPAITIKSKFEHLVYQIYMKGI